MPSRKIEQCLENYVGRSKYKKNIKKKKKGDEIEGNLKKGELTPTWLEHAAFWSGVRRATIAPRSPPRQNNGEHNYLNTSFQYALALSHRPDVNWEMFGYFSIWRNDQEHRKPTYSRTCIERLVCIFFYLYWTVICKAEPIK